GDEELRQKVTEMLTGDYGCTRVWEAWQDGTMTEDDFVPLEETERVDEIVDLILADRKQHELDARIDTLETIKMLNPHSGSMQVDSYDESDSGDAYVFVTLSEKLAELKAERSKL